MLCAFKFHTDTGTPMPNINELLLNTTAQQMHRLKQPFHLCKHCAELLEPLDLEQARTDDSNPGREAAASFDNGDNVEEQVEATSNRRKNKAVDLCEHFNMSHIQYTDSRITPHSKLKVPKPNRKSNESNAAPIAPVLDPSKHTRLKGFMKTDSDGGCIMMYAPQDLLLSSLRSFAANVCKVRGTKDMSKEFVCEAIVDAKLRHERAVSTGEGEFIDETGSYARINRMRFFNVLASEEFRSHLTTLGTHLSNLDLTNNISTGETEFKYFTTLYNSSNESFARNHHHIPRFDMDAGSFSRFPDTAWKRMYTEFKTVGKVKSIIFCFGAI
jgi:hypothetical protein